MEPDWSEQQWSAYDAVMHAAGEVGPGRTWDVIDHFIQEYEMTLEEHLCHNPKQRGRVKNLQLNGRYSRPGCRRRRRRT